MPVGERVAPAVPPSSPGPPADGPAPGDAPSPEPRVGATGSPGHPVGAGHTEPCPRRIRALVVDRWVVDTRAAVYLWEHPRYPAWYLPLSDVAPGVLTPTGRFSATVAGAAELADLTVGGARRDGAARIVRAGTLTAHVRFDWDAVDRWFEEDVEVHVHPRSPYVRVDALPTSREIRVVIGGHPVAVTSRGVVLFETGLPPRWYVPVTDITPGVLMPSATRTRCPYKGEARYWSAVVGGARHDEVAWSYPFPTGECRAIAGMVAFDSELVDVLVDGVPVPDR